MTNKLILHFDARNTLFVADFNSRLTTEKALNTYISGLVWGSVEDGVWKISHDSISTDCPGSGLISFYKYMECLMVKGPDDRPKLRETLGRFTQDNEIQFEPIFLHHLKLLEWEYEFHQYLTIKGSSGKLYHYILPTFFNTIQILYRQKREFSIIIRTFGLDIPPILNAIKAFLNGEHPMYPEKLDIAFCGCEHGLKMNSETNRYLYHFMTCEDEMIKTTENEEEIIEHWNSIEGVAAVRDDFQYWSDNKFHYSASKPLWINYRSGKSDKIYHHIFFDDCIRPRDADSIVHLRRINQSETNFSSSRSSSILSPIETEKYVDLNLVQSDLLECITNHNYFMEKIELCERNFSKMYC